MAESKPTSLETCTAVLTRLWPQSGLGDAEKIMALESGGNATATGYNTNGTTDRGCMQINSVHSNMVNGDLQSLYNPEVNIRVALAIWTQQGWRPWSTARKAGL